MVRKFTVIVCEVDPDSLVAGALLGRAEEGRSEALVTRSERLASFFEPAVQARLPRGYDLVLCGLRVVPSDWDGRSVRPGLMDALRRFVGRIQWFGSGEWDAEDARAIEHLIGEDNLVLAGTGDILAGLVRQRLYGPDDHYEDRLARFAAGRLGADEERTWGRRIRSVLTALKGDARALASAVDALVENRLQGLIDEHGDAAERIEGDNRRVAAERTEPLRRMGDLKLVFVSIPPEQEPFWQEIGAYARASAGAELSLCQLADRPVLVLAREPEVRADLQAWARYVTDTLPGVRTVDAREAVVPLVASPAVAGPAFKDEVLAAMSDGVHLLRS